MELLDRLNKQMEELKKRENNNPTNCERKNIERVRKMVEKKIAKELEHKKEVSQKTIIIAGKEYWKELCGNPSRPELKDKLNTRICELCKGEYFILNIRKKYFLKMNKNFYNSCPKCYKNITNSCLFFN